VQRCRLCKDSYAEGRCAQVGVLAPHARPSRRRQRREAGARRDRIRRRDAPTATGGPALPHRRPGERDAVPIEHDSRPIWTRRPEPAVRGELRLSSYCLRAGTSTTAGRTSGAPAGGAPRPWSPPPGYVEAQLAQLIEHSPTGYGSTW
jgi:hypothetical protein